MFCVIIRVRVHMRSEDNFQRWFSLSKGGSRDATQASRLVAITYPQSHLASFTFIV